MAGVFIVQKCKRSRKLRFKETRIGEGYSCALHMQGHRSLESTEVHSALIPLIVATPGFPTRCREVPVNRRVMFTLLTAVKGVGFPPDSYFKSCFCCTLMSIVVHLSV